MFAKKIIAFFCLRYMLEAMPSEQPFYTELLIDLWNAQFKNNKFEKYQQHVRIKILIRILT